VSPIKNDFAQMKRVMYWRDARGGVLRQAVNKNSYVNYGQCTAAILISNNRPLPASEKVQTWSK
jgi:hypothetical protein